MNLFSVSSEASVRSAAFVDELLAGMWLSSWIEKNGQLSQIPQLNDKNK